MSFPLSPIDGYEYTSPSGIKYIYDSSKNSWNIALQVGSSYEYTELYSVLDYEYSKSVIDTNNQNTDLDFSFNNRPKKIIQRDDDFSLGFSGQILEIITLDPLLFGDFNSNSPKYNFILTE